MFSLNRVQIIGYQTQPVVVRQTPSGASVTDLNVAVPYTFKNDQGERSEGKTFFTVTLWSGMADTASKYLRPGGQVYLSGRLQTDSWDDTQSGEKRSKTKMIATDMILLDPKDGPMEAPAGAAAVTQCLNRCEVIGNATKDPEIRTTPTGLKVLTIGVASNERWKDKNTHEDRERTEFHNVVVWGELAEAVAKAVKKGTKVFASGRIQNRSWETKDGQKRVTTELVAEQFLMLGVKSKGLENIIQTTTADRAAGDEAPRARAPRAEKTSQSVDDLEATALSYQPTVKVEDLPF